MANSIRNTCVLVKVSIGKQSAYITDKEISDKVESQYATHGRGKFVKRLFKDCKEFKDIQSAYNNIYQEYVGETLPWNEAYRILKADQFTKFVNKIDELVNKANEKLDKFVQNLDQHVQDDLTKSGGMNKPTDYPDVDSLRDSFYVKWNFSSVPDNEDFRVIEGLDESEIENLVNKAKESERQTLMNPIRESWSRLYKVVAHMKERLSQYKGTEGERLHSSVVNNVKDCVEVLRKLNITNDPNLDSVMDELENNVLSSADIEKLRVFDQTRNDTVKQVDSILNKMSMFANLNGDKENA